MTLRLDARLEHGGYSLGEVPYDLWLAFGRLAQKLRHVVTVAGEQLRDALNREGRFQSTRLPFAWGF